VSLRGSEATEAISKAGLLRPSGARNDGFFSGNYLPKKKLKIEMKAKKLADMNPILL